MALPAGITTATVTVGVPVTHTGAPVKTFVSIEPSVFLVHAATGTALVDFLEELSIAEGVAGQFTLPHTDQAGFTDENGNAYTNWYYTARITYSTPSKAKNKAPKIKVFQLTTGQTDVDLDTLPGGAPALPYTAPTAVLSSFNGRTGAVELLDTDLPERLSEGELTATYLDKVSAGTTYEAKSDAAAKYGSRLRDAGDTMQTWTRRFSLSDLVTSAGSMINLEHNANGDGPTDPSSKNETFGVDIHNNPGAPPAIVIHQYSDNLQAFRIDNTDSSPALVVFNTQNTTRNPGNVGTGDFLYFSDLINNTMRMRVLGTGAVQIISNDPANSGLNINNASARNVLRLQQDGAEVALNLVVNAGGSGRYAMTVSGQDYGPHFFTSLNGPSVLALTKNGTGSGEILRIVNKGTGNSVAIRDAASLELFAVTATGIPKWTAAANQQTTVGAAGAASALPATPTKYLKVQDSAGTTYVIPAYAAS